MFYDRFEKFEDQSINYTKEINNINSEISSIKYNASKEARSNVVKSVEDAKNQTNISGNVPHLFVATQNE